MEIYPCYNGGKGCPDRTPGCQGNCERFTQAKARNEALKAARAPKAVALYHGEKVRTTADRREKERR